MAERRSLENVFSLQPREREEPPAESVLVPAAEPAAPATAPTRTPRRPRAVVEESAPRPLRELAATSFYVPAQSVARPWRERARRSGDTLAEVLVAASQAISTEQVAQALQRPTWNTAGGGMPSWDAPEPAETSVNVQVRLGAVQAQWLDEQVAATGAQSRSQFVATLLTVHFA